MKKKYILFPLILVTIILFYILSVKLLSPVMTVLLMAFAILALSVYYVCFNKKNDNAILILIIGVGLILRIGYMMYTKCTVRSHDIGGIDVNGYGHASYILRLIQDKKLPQDNYIQHYQQPFFYIVSAIISVIVNGIARCTDNYSYVDAAKIVSCFASVVSLIVSIEIFRELKMKKKGMVIACSFVAFMPAFILSGGRVTPDALAAMFMLWIFLFIVKWLNNTEWKYMVGMAVSFGLGVMTKISCAALVPLAIAVIIYKFATEKELRKKIFFQTIVLAIISLPMGLWYCVRNFVKFGQSFTYVLNPGEVIYTGNVSLFSRIFMININNLVKTPYCAPFKDYNAPVYYLKSALFGEFTYKVPNVISVLLLIAGIAVSIVLVVAIVYLVKNIKKDRTAVIPLVTFAYYYIVSLVFYIKMPYGCSMDYRYMLFLTIPAAYILGNYYDKTQKKAVRNCIVFFNIMTIIMYLTTGIIS